ncbi:MAG: hypothetical protein WCY23_07420, partial [Candidatus Omnitrophota bacterium]
MIAYQGKNINSKKQPLGDIPVRFVKGVGPARAEILKKLDIDTVEDLLYHFPRRYEDRSSFNPINELKEGAHAAVRGEVLTSGVRSGRPRFGRGKGMSVYKMAFG